VPQTPSQAELLAKASAGDREAASELFNRHGPLVRERLGHEIPKRFCSVLTAEDVMQETYIDALLGIGRFVPYGEGSFESWLTTIAKNNLRNAIEALDAEKRGGDRRRIVPFNPEESVAALYELLGATSNTPSRQAATAEAQRALQRAIGQLPEDYQCVVRLYDLERCPIEEVAASLGRRPGAVFMLRARAHHALRTLMGDSSQYFSSSA